MNTKREVTIAAANAGKWKDSIVEGQAYEVISVAISEGALRRLVDAPYRVRFTDDTKMKKLKESSIQAGPMYNFVDLKQVSDLLTKDQIVRDSLLFLIDLRPSVTRIRYNKPVLCVEVCVTDKSKFSHCGILPIWEENFAGNEMLTNGFKEQMTIIGIGLRPNLFRESYGFQTSCFTRLIINPENQPEARELLKSITEAAIELGNTVKKQPQFSELYLRKKDVITIEQFFHIAQEPPIQSMLLDVLTYTIRATIIHAFSELQTTYRSCALCSKGMPKLDYDNSDIYPNKRCSNKTGATTYRYRIKIEAKDNGARILLTLFDRAAQDIFQFPASQVEELKTKSVDSPAFKASLTKHCTRLMTSTSDMT